MLKNIKQPIPPTVVINKNVKHSIKFPPLPNDNISNNMNSN